MSGPHCRHGWRAGGRQDPLAPDDARRRRHVRRGSSAEPLSLPTTRDGGDACPSRPTGETRPHLACPDAAVCGSFVENGGDVRSLEPRRRATAAEEGEGQGLSGRSRRRTVAVEDASIERHRDSIEGDDDADRSRRIPKNLPSSGKCCRRHRYVVHRKMVKEARDVRRGTASTKTRAEARQHDLVTRRHDGLRAAESLSHTNRSDFTNRTAARPPRQRARRRDLTRPMTQRSGRRRRENRTPRDERCVPARTAFVSSSPRRSTARAGARRRPQAVQAEGHGPRAPGFDALAAQGRRRRHVRPQAQELGQHQAQQEGGQARGACVRVAARSVVGRRVGMPSEMRCLYSATHHGRLRCVRDVEWNTKTLVKKGV